MRLYLLIAMGGAIGTVLRFFISEVAERNGGDSFPWATIGINVAGSLLIGFLFTATAAGARWPLDPEWRLTAMVGFCGGFTTFSAFSLQTLILLRQEAWMRASLNVVLSVATCLVAVWLGHLLATAANSSRTAG